MLYLLKNRKAWLTLDRRIKEFDLSSEIESLDDVFRQIDLQIEDVQHLKTENEAHAINVKRSSHVREL